MAFLKTATKENGVSGTYWRILHFEPIRSAKKCSVNLVCYVNKDIADLETDDSVQRYLWPAETFYIDYSSLDEKFPTVDQLYQLLKEQHPQSWGDGVVQSV